MAVFAVSELKELDALAAKFAQALGEYPCPPLLLKGGLGCGKTTFVRHLVSHLPGGADCEVSSPSFNICNIYPSSPEIAHFDLYRCGENIPAELAESLDNENILVIVEWSGFLPPGILPSEWLDINFKLDKNIRLLEIGACGETAKKLLACLNQN